jgi:hypothetical protein
VIRKCWYKASAGMVISIHLPPPVIMESAADRALVTHMLCWSELWRKVGDDGVIGAA